MAQHKFGGILGSCLDLSWSFVVILLKHVPSQFHHKQDNNYTRVAILIFQFHHIMHKFQVHNLFLLQASFRPKADYFIFLSPSMPSVGSRLNHFTTEFIQASKTVSMTFRFFTIIVLKCYHLTHKAHSHYQAHNRKQDTDKFHNNVIQIQNRLNLKIYLELIRIQHSFFHILGIESLVLFSLYFHLLLKRPNHPTSEGNSEACLVVIWLITLIPMLLS